MQQEAELTWKTHVIPEPNLNHHWFIKQLLNGNTYQVKLKKQLNFQCLLKPAESPMYVMLWESSLIWFLVPVSKKAGEARVTMIKTERGRWRLLTRRLNMSSFIEGVNCFNVLKGCVPCINVIHTSNYLLKKFVYIANVVHMFIHTYIQPPSPKNLLYFQKYFFFCTRTLYIVSLMLY